MKRKMFWLGEDDEHAITIIADRYGCESGSQAVRLALRILAESQRLIIELPPHPKHAHHSSTVAEENLPLKSGR